MTHQGVRGVCGVPNVRRIGAGSYRAMPWKNGGGTTTEIARSPAGESLDDFDWRVSVARVAQGGPFSRFAGVDRSIAILEGEGLVLEVDAKGEKGETKRLDPRSPPFSFPADVAVTASLVGGAIEDFNVMTRRGRWRHLLTRVGARDGAEAMAPELGDRGDVGLVFVVAGTAEAERGGHHEHLGPRDTLLFERGGSLALTLSPEAELLAVALWRD
jgi:environmental stress-induced protein Ves